MQKCTCITTRLYNMQHRCQAKFLISCYSRQGIIYFNGLNDLTAH